MQHRSHKRTSANPRRALVWAALLSANLGGCGKSSTELGEGGSIVSGSAGPNGSRHAARELQHCDAPVATLALVENPDGYAYGGSYQLPATPLPLVRLMAQQSNCFRIVGRAAGLHNRAQERGRASQARHCRQGQRLRSPVQPDPQPDVLRARRRPRDRRHFGDDPVLESVHRFGRTSQTERSPGRSPAHGQ